MLRIFFYLVFIIAAAILSAWIASVPGYAGIVWQGYKIETSAAFLLLFVLLATALLSTAYLTIRFILHAPRRIRRLRQHRNQARGLQATAQAMVSLSGAEPERAKRYAKRAHKYLGDTAITCLLDAQLAKLEHDEPRTRAALEKMLKHPETRALAARSLAEYNARQGNLIEAQKLAWQAKDTDPKNPHAYRSLFQISLQSRQWQQAQQAVEKAVWQRVITRYIAKRWRALLHFARAQAFAETKDMPGALFEAERAFSHLPALAPVAAFYATLLMEEKRFTESANVLKRAWKLGPHPLLTDAVMRMAQERPAALTVKLARKLSSARPEHPESAVLLARAAMQASDWKTARSSLERAVAASPTVRIYATLADLEERDLRNTEAAANWRVKAANVSNEERWVCKECHHFTEAWSVLCQSCGAVDGFEWTKPPTTLQHQLI